MIDENVFYRSAAVYDNFQLFRKLLFGVIHLKYPRRQPFGRQNVPAIGRNDRRALRPQNRDILHDHLPRNAETVAQRPRALRLVRRTDRRKNTFPTLFPRHVADIVRHFSSPVPAFLFYRVQIFQRYV